MSSVEKHGEDGTLLCRPSAVQPTSLGGNGPGFRRNLKVRGLVTVLFKDKKDVMGQSL